MKKLFENINPQKTMAGTLTQENTDSLVRTLSSVVNVLWYTIKNKEFFVEHAKTERLQQLPLAMRNIKCCN